MATSGVLWKFIYTYYFSNMKSSYVFDNKVLKYLKYKIWNICNFQLVIYEAPRFKEELSGTIVEVVPISRHIQPKWLNRVKKKKLLIHKTIHLEAEFYC